MNRVILRAVFLLATAGILVFPLFATETSRRRATSPTPAPAVQYRSDQIEAYQTDDVLAFIRPGLKIIVNSITIGSDRKPVIDLSLTDNLDQPLDRLGKTTPGAISLSFIMAYYDPAVRQYTSYTTRSVTNPTNSPRPGATAIQAGADSGGTFTDLETGHVKYTFKTVLPTGFDQAKTHTLGIYSARNLTSAAVPGIPEDLAKNYYFNVEKDFRPDGGTVKDQWDKMREVSTCLNCHETLGAHGGSRNDVKLCALCHQPQTSDPDTGNTVDLKVMVHKIHRGDNLPSVLAGTPYVIWGNAQSIHDFSTVAYPQNILNCANCHEGNNAATKGAQASAWYTNPSREACGSCHDDVNFATGANHPAGAQADDKACASCHVPDSGVEFDASIKGAHVVPEKSKQLKGMNATIVSVSNMAPGKKPTVVFKFTANDGTAIDGTKFSTFSPMFTGPTNSYAGSPIRENAITKGVYDATAGTTTYTFVAAIPANATGTWTVSADLRRTVALKRGDGKPDISVSESTVNPVKHVALNGGTATPRRISVTLAQCNNCHDRLSLHGGQRNNVEECVLCHAPTESDVARRPASAGQPESISFQRMIHRIHTGEELTQDFTIYAFGNVATNFNEVRFPSDRRNCSNCHAGAAYTLPLPTGIGSVTTLRDYFPLQGPATAACLGCHDNQDAAAHAYLNTATFPGSGISAEACATCHGTGKDWSVERAHAR